MTDIAAPAADSSADDHHLLSKLTITAGLAAIADVLFYEQKPGLSVALFAIALIGGTLVANRAPTGRRRMIHAGLILLAGLVPVVEDLTPLSFLLLTLAIVTAIALLTYSDTLTLRTPLSASHHLLLIGPIRLIPDAAKALHGPSLTRGLVVWFVPLVLGSVFVMLFALANPLIAQWLEAMIPDQSGMQFAWLRLLFWFVALSLIWPFIHIRWRRKAVAAAAPDTSIPTTSVPDTALFGLDHLLSPPTILRALILFNLLFAVQTTLDIVYLWSGAALPAGTSYADYAHRGAYPLIVTALLAAGFVLVAIRPTLAQPRLAGVLLYLWVGQNVMLVLSSILRLKLYIDIYLLTYWRLAALIWMVLVAIGLILIVVRIKQSRSHRWLIRMNLFAALATLYVCALTNFDAIIAGYNVTHSRDAGGQGVQLDVNYLVSLGPQALPAIDTAIRLQTLDGGIRRHLQCMRDNILLAAHRSNIASWRSQSFRTLRLQYYLNTHPESANAG